MAGFFRFPFFSRRQIRRDIDRELRFHIDERVADLVRQGHSPEDAHLQAERELGDADTVRDDLRAIDERIERSRERGETLASIRQDAAYAFRSLRRSPGLTVAIVVTLALGLGVNLATFSFLDAVFLRLPGGVERAGEIRRPWVEIRFRTSTQFWSGYSYPQYVAAQAALAGRAQTAVYRGPDKRRFGGAESEQQLRVSWVNDSYFDLLGVRPAIGRFPQGDEHRMGAGGDVAVLSHDFWRREFAADSAVLGRDIVIATRPYTVIGIAPSEFRGVEVEAEDVWLPIASVRSSGSSPWWTGHAVNGFQLLVRPTIATSEAELEQRIAAALSRPEVRSWPGDTAHVVQFGSVIRAQGPGKKQQEVQIATRLAGVTVIVLLIAGANVINLLLARAVRRRREIGVRLALGISRARLVRLLVTESVILAALSITAAAAAAWWGSGLLRTLLLPGIQWGVSPLQWRVFGIATAAALAVGVLAGLIPALQAMNTRLTGALKSGAGIDAASGSSRLRDALVVAQAALSVVLLVGAGLFVRSLDNVRALRIGYDADRVVMGTVNFSTRDSLRDARVPSVLREVADELRSAPGIERVGHVSTAPRQGISFITFYPDVDTTRVAKVSAFFNAVSPEFFAVTGMRLLRGSGFPDVPAGAMPPVVVVNEAMAQAQWPGEDALGRCLRFAPAGECYHVTGIVETAVTTSIIEKPQPQFFLPLDNVPAEMWVANWIIARVDPRARDEALSRMRLALRDAFPAGRPELHTLENLLEPDYRPWTLGATLFLAFGGLALIVAAVGIYSTVAYGVAQRTHEFGVRTALGAGTPAILRQVIGGSMRTVALGVVLGLALALAGGRLVAALLYGTSPHDPLVLTAVGVTLLVGGVIAALGPAWRASKVDPMRALRAE